MKKNRKIKKRYIPLIVVVIIVGISAVMLNKPAEYLGPAVFVSEPEYFEKMGIKKGQPEAWEDGFRTGEDGTYEWWYTDAEFEDGTTIVAGFYTKDPIFIDGPLDPYVTISIKNPDGTNIDKVISGNGEMYASKEICDVQIGDSYLKYVDGDYELYVKDEDVEYNVLMESTVDMWRPETGYFHFGEDREDYYAWFVAQPASIVTGTLTIDNKVKELEGTGYHDHNWGNIGQLGTLSHWYWGRAVIDDYTVIVADNIATEEYGNTRFTPMFMIAKNGVILEDDGTAPLVTREGTHNHEGTGKFMDDHLTFTKYGADGQEYKVELIREKDILSEFLMEGLPWYEQMLAKLDGVVPTYVRVLGDVKLTVTEDGKETVHEAEGLWEQMSLSADKEAIIAE